ncbi:RAMP superfamily CRISPR-associated protein [Merismopedia glauca]|uniref:Type III-B CRISPR module RAMP protein Cmr4 n=1 Tax=Merismopedia glauca CCAP 1448/3 TaxID=1296344 RepID=A0A2T1C0D8_9CYAN|nr:RAMP superfamily CRISPR-associated protein [Merismopedia glauca]PSB01664.1 type III-B CRISPR module RAMP protein Cmr4 [Merismopedia glauca CCAP 1448/3]
MYHKAHGIIETLAPLHVGASAGEETGNLNLIFRDQFTQTGIIPGSSIRGRLRADMRETKPDRVGFWYGKEAKENQPNSTSEGIIKFEYASLLWLPVFCPDRPVVRVTCPALLERYQRLRGRQPHNFKPYSYWGEIDSKLLFFNLGFLPLKEKRQELFDEFMPSSVTNRDRYLLLVVDDKEMPMIHDMGLYRQSRVQLEDHRKQSKDKGFFNVEALPEGTVLVFPIAMRNKFDNKPVDWQEYLKEQEIEKEKELYFGGLESVGFGRTQVTLASGDQNNDGGN